MHFRFSHSSLGSPHRVIGPHLLRNNAGFLSPFTSPTRNSHTLETIISQQPSALGSLGGAKPRTAEDIHSHNLESSLQGIPLLLNHRARADSKDWYETRPYSNYPAALRSRNFTAGALHGPGKIAVPALIRARKDETESLVLAHIGQDLCGHVGIVHGGMVATLLDEALGRTGVLNLPDAVGFTASMSVDYRNPTRADQFVAITTVVARKEGRKVWIEGLMEDLGGMILAEAKALYIQPSQTQLMDKTALRQIFGAPPPSA